MKSLVDKFEWIEWPQKNLPGVTPEDVLRIEKEIGFKIPLDYVEVSRLVHGKEPIPGNHVADGSGSALGRLFHFSGDLNDNRLGWGDWINENSDTSLLPFSQDGGGNFFAFDFGTDPQNANPTVVFWDHETQIVTTLAESFTEFLGQLEE